ncbi:conserved membrane hypothetical protein [metagenome]|uniref:Uncharacterized protein n=1 Tax=metagenome TaxID=256318 RepID=A0A2P2BZ14_9ZZZZ
MTNTRKVVAVVLLVIEGGLAALGVLFHYGLTAEYGDITDSALDGLRSGFSTGTGAIALGLVAVPALFAVVVSTQPWIRVAAASIPVLMVVLMLAVTPSALRHKLDVQYDAVPQCVSLEDMGPGPGTRAARASQQAFESIDHIGYFGGGGGSGVGGCDRSFVLTDDVDVVEHYRAALDDAGWRVVEDDGQRLRAEKDDMAFEVVDCGHGGVVWAGAARLSQQPVLRDRGAGAVCPAAGQP